MNPSSSVIEDFAYLIALFGGLWYVWLICCWLLIAGGAVQVASNKGYNTLLATLLGLLFGMVALIVYGCLPDLVVQRRLDRLDYWLARADERSYGGHQTRPPYA